MQDEARVRTICTRAPSDTFQHYLGDGVVPSATGSTFVYNQGDAYLFFQFA